MRLPASRPPLGGHATLYGCINLERVNNVRLAANANAAKCKIAFATVVRQRWDQFSPFNSKCQQDKRGEGRGWSALLLRKRNHHISWPSSVRSSSNGGCVTAARTPRFLPRAAQSMAVHHRCHFQLQSLMQTYYILIHHNEDCSGT